MPKLIIQEHGRKEVFTHECAEEVISVGRLDTNTIKLGGDGVSRQHAKIVAEGNNFFLIDLKSGNGTFLNGIPVKPNEKSLLKSGDTIIIDTFDLKFRDDKSLKKSFDDEVTESDILEVKLLKKVLTALDKDMVPSIEVLNGASEGKKIFFTDEMNEMVIGRDPECDFPVNEYVISRQHARIIKRWGGIVIRDLESKNGTFLNNRRVVEEYLHDGDRIALGTIVFIYRNPQEVNLAHFDELKPKYRPAPVKPNEIPGLAKEKPAKPEARPSPEEKPEEKAAEESPPPEESSESALDEWDNLEKSNPKVQAYPTPKAKIEAIKRLTPIEIGMLGLGAVVLIFALVTIVNLLAS